MKLSIFLLEDDLELSDTIASYLRRHGFEVVQSFDALDAKEKLYERSFDLLLIDVKVPFQDGFSFLKEIRSQKNDTPAIFITSLHAAKDAERGFASGCDDYIRKPFSLKELLLRIEAVIKRYYQTHEDLISIDENISFDSINHALFVDGERISLKPKEIALLKLFLRNKNKIVTKEAIFEALWKYDEEPNEGSLRAFVSSLRKYLGKDKIETIKEVGYRFVSE
ncbi:MAG: response regulator transcription factor [Epsilonproteobacteria bacterium]|nr:response regulator transcription factor [Campylobacterota bacterium]